MTAGIIIVIALAGFVLFFFVVKRLVRMAVRVALVGAFLFALLVGAVAWWWYAPLGNSSSPTGRGARPASSPRPARK
jgi:hypothetical protein